MEGQKANTTDAQQAISKLPNASSNATEKVITGWLVLCAQHFRVDLNDADIAIYTHALRQISTERLDTAFQRCLRECEFMPKLVDVCNRLPELSEAPKHAAPIEDFVKEPETWTEQAGDLRFTYRGDRQGYRQVVRVEKA